MNPDDVAAGMLALISSGAKHASELSQGTFQHLAQGLGVVNTNLIHQHGGVADDPGLIAALQTAAGSPKQGAIAGA